jgi:hypothetical protein
MNRDYGCKVQKNEFPIFYFNVMIIFQFSSAPTTQWLISHPPTEYGDAVAVAPLITTKKIRSREHMVRKRNFPFVF